MAHHGILSKTFNHSLRYPAVRNSEGVVLWTHDVGSGLVTTDTAQVSRDGQQGSSENGQQNAPEIDAGAGTSAGNGEVEVCIQPETMVDSDGLC